MKRNLRFIFSALASVFLAFLVGGIVISFTGENSLEVYKIMFSGAFGGKMEIGETLIKSTTLIFTGLSYAFAYKCGLINVGAEGQLFIGAACCTLVGTHFQGLPSQIHLPLAILAGFLGGSLWGGLVGWLKVRHRANEVITTVMLNYIAIHLVNYLVSGPMIAPPGDYPQSAQVLESARFTRFIEGSRVHTGLILAIIVLIIYGIYFKYTSGGYAMKVVGRNNTAAVYAGIDIKKNILMSMLISGGLAGLAGCTEILGVQYRVIQDFSSGYGFDGVAVALLGANSPLGIFVSSILFGALRSGGNVVQMFTSVPIAIIKIIQALVILFVLIAPFAKGKRS